MLNRNARPSAASAPTAVLTRVRSRHLRALGTEQHAESWVFIRDRQGLGAAWDFFYTLAITLHKEGFLHPTCRYCLVAMVSPSRGSQSSVPWVCESELGLVHDDSAGAAARRSASKRSPWTWPLRGSLHQLVTQKRHATCYHEACLAHCLAAAPGTLPNRSTVGQGKAQTAVGRPGLRELGPIIRRARRCGWLQLRGASTNPATLDELQAATNDINISYQTSVK